jgi:hypothetical protein
MWGSVDVGKDEDCNVKIQEVLGLAENSALLL